MNIFTFVKTHVSILDLVSQYVSLKKGGGYWKGPCPFHSEKTASFTVSPHREIFYCFGCHATGDVIGFMSQMENCSQIEAVKLLAERFSLELPESVAPKGGSLETTNIDEKKRYFALCQEVAQWCHEELYKHMFVMQYLEQRAVSQESIERFELGYFSPTENSIKALAKRISAKQFLIKDLIDAGIISEGKSLYSSFEQRLIFPIKDHLGRFCGFGGRVIKPTDERSKYYNSKENHYFQKGSLIFGLDLAKKEIQKTGSVFLVEGYVDCIAMAQHGYVNTVATLGTACTIEHLKQLAHHAQRVFLIYDGDAAGQKAMLRFAELCWQVNLEMNVIFLPQNEDPASFLAKGNDLQPLIDQAQDIFLYLLNSLGKEYESQPLQQKLSGIRNFLEIIRKFDDKLKQDLILQKASLIFALPFSSLKEELHKINNAPFKEMTLEPKQPELVCMEISVLEKKFIYAILNDTALLKRAEVDHLTSYMPKEIKNLVEKIKQAEGATEKELFLALFDMLDEDEKQIVNQVLMTQEQEDFDQILLLIEKKYWKIIVHGTKERIKQAQDQNNATEVQKIVSSFLELKKKLLHKGLI